MPVIPAVAAAFETIGMSVAAATATAQFVVATAISFGISKVAEFLGGNQRSLNADAFNSGIKTNQTSNVAPIPVIYGERVVGGVERRMVSGENNKYLWRVMVLGEGEIYSVTNVYLNDKDVDTEAKYAGLVTWWAHTGADGQAADDNLLTEIADWSPQHIGYKIAYIVVRIEYNYDAFSSGLPTLTARVRGKKVYDPRDGSTAWSNNPALCIRDYLTNTLYGRGIDATSIDDATFIDAANHCDELVTVKDVDGSEIQQARYTCNGLVNTDNTSLENIQQLCTSCRGVIVPPGDKYKLRVDRVDAVSFAFTESNIIGSWNITGPGTKNILNKVNAQFFDAANNWEQTITVTDSSTHRTLDNGRVFEADISLPFTDQLQRANIIAQHHLKQSRQGWQVSFTAPIEALQCEVMDVVSITHPTPGWDAKPFRIHMLELKEEDIVQVTAQEYDDSVYTFDLLTPPTYPDSNLPDPLDVPMPRNLVLQSGTDQLLIAGDGTVISRLLATWDAPASAFVTEYEVAYRASGGSWTSIRTSEKQHYFTPVRDGSLYDVRVRAINAWGHLSEYLTITGYTVIGKTAAPAAPFSFALSLQRDYTRQFSWQLNTTDRDAAGYQIRYSTNLSAAWADMTPLHDGLLISSPWETNLLNAGTYLFAIKTIDTSGNESTIARFLTATLTDSPTSSIFYSRYPRLEGWPGTITGYIDPITNDLESNDPTTWDDLGTMTWDEWLTWGLNGDDLVYQFEDIDLGAILTFRPVISVQAKGAVTYEIDYSEDGSTWNGWTTPVGDVTAQYLRVRVTVVDTEARITSMSILLDGAQATEDISDLDTSTISSPAGDLRLPLTKTFNTIKSISVALQNTGAGWSWEIIDKDATNGPRIKIYDNTGTLADAVIDATIKGY